MPRSVRLGITLGDINGIGPEIVLKALRKRWPAHVEFVIYGAMQALVAEGRKKSLCAVDECGEGRLKPAPGQIRVDASRAAMTWIRCAVEDALLGRIDGVVTAPICKEGLMKAGFTWPGHTEYIASLADVKQFGMLLTGGPLAVLLATRHLPLRLVPGTLTSADIVEHICMLESGLRWLGRRKPQIGVCGLNPHAGDGGVLGREDEAVIRPAVRKAAARNIMVEGPLAADTAFYHAYHGRYHGLVAMYHDQGLPPLKMIAFDSGVNITLGLPFVRTSPDHGTAFDLAGSGKAQAGSMISAIETAIKLAGKRNPWRT